MTRTLQDNLVTDSEARGSGIPVRVEGVSRVFDGEVSALAEVSLSVPAGQFVSILGPSGCGKSTLLRLVAGLDRPTGGSLQVGEGAGARQLVAYVFQDPHLMPWRTLVDNVALPLELRGMARRQRRSVALEAIGQVDLGEASNRYPNQLSGGMRMRASLARALVTRPRLLLLDEPFGALDELTRHHLHAQLLGLWQKNAMTVLFVTHSVSEAAFLAQRAVVMSRRPGRIIYDQPIDLPRQRSSALRGEAIFAAATAPLYKALERGAM